MTLIWVLLQNQKHKENFLNTIKMQKLAMGYVGKETPEKTS